MKEQDKINNYNHLLKLRDFFSIGAQPNEIWIKEEREFITGLYYAFPEPSKLHSEIRNKKFRDFCNRVEYLLIGLYQEITTKYYFNIESYRQLIEHIIVICDIVYDNDDNDDILDLFNRLTVN